MSREPTADEAAGMAWWNGMSKAERFAWGTWWIFSTFPGYWSPAAAWAAYKDGYRLVNGNVIPPGTAG